MIDRQPERRRKAEAEIANHPVDAGPPIDPNEDLVHELRVHQIELEMQNEELRLMQVAMDATRQRYFDLYDLAPVGYCTVSTQGLILQSNLKATTLLGLPRKALKDQPLTRFISPSDQNTYYLYNKKVLASGDALPCELGMLRHDGTPFWVQLMATTASDEHDATVLRVVLTDITERRTAQAELRIAATAFKSQHGILVTDAARVILRVNPAFTEMSGYSAEDSVGQTPSMFSSGRHDAMFFASMWAAVAAHGSWHGEIWNRRKSGEIFPMWMTITAVQDTDGRPSHYVGSFVDISLHKAAQDQITKLAFYDQLTSLPNRRLLMDRLENALTLSERHRRHGALMFVDLDHFKNVNDTLGHACGDLLLVQVANRLSACLRDGDTVARLGGDEFVVMLQDLSEDAAGAAAQAELVGKHMQTKLNERYVLNGHTIHSTASIGVTLFLDHQVGIEDLLRQSDLSMYDVKVTGRNALRFFEPQMQAAVTERAALEAGLRVAIEQEQLVLHYQVQVSGDGKPTGVEALVRWAHPERGLMLPLEFIALAEDTGLILPLGQWVLETACAQLALWGANPDTEHLTMAVNVSARQFHQSNFVDNVQAALKRSGANPERLKLELTESLLLNKVDDAIAKMTTLKAQGIGFSLDDFGTGYSSLSYLKRLPLGQLKIDQSFVQDVMTDQNDAAIARAIVALGHSMGLQVVAEGVETAEQRSMLTSIGCDAYQGFHFGRPVSAASLADTLRPKP